MKFIKIKEMSIPGAILLSGIIVGASVFLTTWFFFGGVNNKTKAFLDNPSRITAPQNTLTPAQIQQLQQAQQQRMMLNTQTPPVPVPTATTTKPKVK